MAYRVDNNFCTNCGACTYACPMGAIGYFDFGIDQEKCIGCGTCYKECSGFAIEMIKKRVGLFKTETRYVIDANKCNRCGSCVEHCYSKAIHLHSTNGQTEINDDCIECGSCADVCPVAAIVTND